MKSNFLPRLDLYFKELDTLCGYVFNHPEFEDSAQIRTNHVGRIEKWIDLDGSFYSVAICSGDEKFKLGRPATLSQVEDFRRGAEMPKIEIEKQRDQVSDIKRSFLG